MPALNFTTLTILLTCIIKGQFFRLETSKNNFDLIRLLLSLTVFLVHSYELSQKPELKIITSFLSSGIAINAFFVISGFLISLSYERSKSSLDYLIKRIRRIYPAYVFVVLLCAIMAMALSDLPPNKYFSTGLIKYLLANLSFLNLLNPELPGVFTGNHVKAVNGALWSIRFEVTFYLLLPFIGAIFHRYSKHGGFLFIFISIFLSYFFLDFISTELNNKTFSLLAFHLPVQLLCFMCGAFLFHYFNFFERNSLWAFLIAVACYIINKYLNIPLLTPIFLSVITIFMAFNFMYLGNFGKFGDLSYGVYLWHFPVLQTLISLKMFDSNPYIFLLAATILVLALAFLSWHVIEKPFLKKSSHYRQVAK